MAAEVSQSFLVEMDIDPQVVSICGFVVWDNKGNHSTDFKRSEQRIPSFTITGRKEHNSKLLYLTCKYHLWSCIHQPHAAVTISALCC